MEEEEEEVRKREDEEEELKRIRNIPLNQLTPPATEARELDQEGEGEGEGCGWHLTQHFLVLLWVH